MNNVNKAYPTSYELEEVISNIADRMFVDSFAQSRGIFITQSDKSVISKELSNLFFEARDLEQIRNIAYGTKSKHVLTGFLINSQSKEFDLVSFYENLRINDISKRKKGLEISQLIKQTTEDGSDCFKGTIAYEKRRVGRIEFLQAEKGSFDFFVHLISEGIWQVEVDCNKSTDTGEILDLFKRNISEGTNIESIEIETLSTKDTIIFFDRLSIEGLGKDWQINDIKKLTVKKGLDKKEDEDSDDDDVIEEENLIGIRQAILEGKNLRENGFVKQCETSGYRFSSMTYEFTNRSSPDIIQVKAEFKGRPKAFEVGIAYYGHNMGVSGEEREDEILSQKDDRNYRTKFWSNAKRIYDEILIQG